MPSIGMPPSTPHQLSRVTDRVTFLYLEHCTLGRDGGALTATDESGVVYVPVASLSVLLLGPGTRVTHQAVTVAADSGCSLVWVGEEGVRYYAHGRPLARSSRLLVAQAEKVSNTRTRLAVARAMYEMRFPDESTENLTMQQLRGKEGARVRKIYRHYSQLHNVQWNRREYDPSDFSIGDPINQALSAAHTCLYGLSHAVIVSLGCSPGLGFVHTGGDRSFVYDIGDLYKTEITIPLAFEIVEKLNNGAIADSVEISSIVRRECRERFRKENISERIAHDIKLLLVGNDSADEDFWADVIQLWDSNDRRVASGINYAPPHQDADPESK